MDLTWLYFFLSSLYMSLSLLMKMDCANFTISIETTREMGIMVLISTNMVKKIRMESPAKGPEVNSVILKRM